MSTAIMKAAMTGLAVLFFAAGSASAAEGVSNNFHLDCRTGIREARATEAIQYSTAWATNLTAVQQADATAVVKVNPVLKMPPKYVVVDLSGGPNAAQWPVSTLDDMPEGGWTDEYKTEKLVLRHIPAGSFIMGGRNTDYPGAVNTNLHMVTLTKDFYIGVFEVTQRQWELAMGSVQACFTNSACYATRPMDKVDYRDIRGYNLGMTWPETTDVDDGSFLSIFRNKTGFSTFDLPTEAQWEYACRAGTTTALNNGKNISTVDALCPNINEVARYAYNSGYFSNGGKQDVAYQALSNSTTEYGTAKVGSYKPNSFGLYDMLGNVYEYCLDVWGPEVTGAIDPHGPSPSSNRTRTIKGGGWAHNPTRSGYHYTFENHGQIGYNYYGTVGLRLCFHSASIPDFSAGTELVRASGASAADWTPTQTGTYLLTHEVQTNGVPAAETLTALFRVGGPELSIEPQGELTNGVEIAIGGADGWPVYYTTDGSEPTSMSALYDGPFSLPSNAVVRAVAISEGGVSGDPARADFTLHDPFGLVGAVARPRYPWNGLVDVDFELRGNPDLEYLVALEALDLLGHTNLPVRTVIGETLLAPGHHRVTWNAAADIAGECQFSQVSVTVKATGSVLNRFSRTLNLSVARYTGTETLAGVPTLVRLSEAIPGFRYADFASPADGADLAFFDADENELPYEIDEWNTNGESLVWVRLPVLTNGVPFTCAYGNPQLSTLNPQLTSHAVWRDYAGVWHMNEDAGTAFDSTEHHLDGIPDHGTNELADVSQMIAYENGACGRARVNATTKLIDGNFLLVPSYDVLQLGGVFMVSGWFWANCEDLYYSKLFSRSWAAGGWGMETCNKTTQSIGVVGGGGAGYPYVKPVLASSLASGWSKLDCVYMGTNVWCYQNGVLLTNGLIVAVSDNGFPLAIGNNPHLRTDSDSFVGQYDEIRLRGGSLSADRIKADYDMIADRNWLAYGIVRKTGAADAESMGGVQLWENGPYWAECNVGASQPEEYGYYFWWGDTVGYKRVGDGWNAVDGSRTGFSFESANCPTCGKGNPELRAAGYADLSGNLVSAYDAATAYLGAPWRMPTDAEWQALIGNCTTAWITTNGVSGRLVTGKGDYASKSIFLPATGIARFVDLDDIGSVGRYWSSSLDPVDSRSAWYLLFTSSSFGRFNSYRDCGRSVRPIRGFAE